MSPGPSSRVNAPKPAGEVAPEPEALRRATELQSRRPFERSLTSSRRRASWTRGSQSRFRQAARQFSCVWEATTWLPGSGRPLPCGRPAVCGRPPCLAATQHQADPESQPGCSSAKGEGGSQPQSQTSDFLALLEGITTPPRLPSEAFQMQH